MKGIYLPQLVEKKKKDWHSAYFKSKRNLWDKVLERRELHTREKRASEEELKKPGLGFFISLSKY